MIEELVRMYKRGAITADHLVLESLHRLDPSNPAVALRSLPEDLLERVLDYANHYRPGSMRTNYGIQPAADQVAAAKHWIEANAAEADAERVAMLKSRQ